MDHPATGRELYRIHAQNGLELVEDATSGVLDSGISAPASFGGAAFVVRDRGLNAATQKVELLRVVGDDLYAFDGTTLTMVKDIRPGSAGSSPRHLIVVGPRDPRPRRSARGRRLSHGTSKLRLRLSDSMGRTHVARLSVRGVGIRRRIRRSAATRKVWSRRGARYPRRPGRQDDGRRGAR